MMERLDFEIFLLSKKLCNPHGRPRYMSIIPLKGSHLFKIIKSETIFKQKLTIDSTILNK